MHKEDLQGESVTCFNSPKDTVLMEAGLHEADSGQQSISSLWCSTYLIFSPVLQRPPTDLDFKAHSHWQLNREQNEDILPLLSLA